MAVQARVQPLPVLRCRRAGAASGKPRDQTRLSGGRYAACSRRSSWSASSTVAHECQDSSHLRSQSRIAVVCSIVTFCLAGRPVIFGGIPKQQLVYVPSQRGSGEADPGAEVLAPRTPSQARGHSDVYRPTLPPPQVDPGIVGHLGTRELAHGCRQDDRPLPRSRRIAGGSNCGHSAIIPATTDSTRIGNASDNA